MWLASVIKVLTDFIFTENTNIPAALKALPVLTGPAQLSQCSPHTQLAYLPRTSFQLPRTTSPCPSDITVRLICSSPQPSLVLGPSPGRCLIPGLPRFLSSWLRWWDRTGSRPCPGVLGVLAHCDSLGASGPHAVLSEQKVIIQ